MCCLVVASPLPRLFAHNLCSDDLSVALCGVLDADLALRAGASRQTEKGAARNETSSLKPQENDDNEKRKAAAEDDEQTNTQARGHGDREEKNKQKMTASDLRIHSGYKHSSAGL